MREHVGEYMREHLRECLRERPHVTLPCVLWAEDALVPGVHRACSRNEHTQY